MGFCLTTLVQRSASLSPLRSFGSYSQLRGHFDLLGTRYFQFDQLSLLIPRVVGSCGGVQGERAYLPVITFLQEGATVTYRLLQSRF